MPKKFIVHLSVSLCQGIKNNHPWANIICGDPKKPYVPVNKIYKTMSKFCLNALPEFAKLMIYF
jgi:hypothetical protein